LVIGSFQKDGNGWGKGLTPKLIKGPDIFINTLKVLNNEINDLYVLLTGPARGYVKKELNKAGIPYSHFYNKTYSNISKFYHALDLYMITSREEGGPRAVLESMASGVPLVTTRVGQAMDIVQNGKNGWMVDSEDIEGLSFWAKYVRDNKNNLDNILLFARNTALNNCYSAQVPLWEKFMDGFVLK
jgi:Glycosyltransferase